MMEKMCEQIFSQERKSEGVRNNQCDDVEDEHEWNEETTGDVLQLDPDDLATSVM